MKIYYISLWGGQMIDCLCGNHMTKVGVFANVKSKTLISYMCFTCGATTVQCEQAKRIAV